MNQSTDHTTHQGHARSLLAAIEGSPSVIFPRRATIVEWLNAYLVRASSTGHTTDDAEAKDLIALDRFLRTYQIRVPRDSAA